MVHSWSNICHLGFQSAGLIAIRTTLTMLDRSLRERHVLKNNIKAFSPNPQFNPQNAISCTTYALFGSPRMSVKSLRQSSNSESLEIDIANRPITFYKTSRY